MLFLLRITVCYQKAAGSFAFIKSNTKSLKQTAFLLRKIYFLYNTTQYTTKHSVFRNFGELKFFRTTQDFPGYSAFSLIFNDWKTGQLFQDFPVFPGRMGTLATWLVLIRAANSCFSFQTCWTCSCVCLCLPLLSVSVGLLVRWQLDDENAGLSVLEALLVVGRLWRALGVQHKDLGHKDHTSMSSPGPAALAVNPQTFIDLC